MVSFNLCLHMQNLLCQKTLLFVLPDLNSWWLPFLPTVVPPSARRCDGAQNSFVNCEARCEKEVDGCKLFQPLPVVPSSQGVGAEIHNDYLISERKKPFLFLTGCSLDRWAYICHIFGKKRYRSRSMHNFLKFSCFQNSVCTTKSHSFLKQCFSTL